MLIGDGILDLNASSASSAHPEWWGARSDGTGDSGPALIACLAAHPVMQLAHGDYAIATSWRISRPFCRIEGAGFRGTSRGQGTRIVVTNGHDDVLRVGTDEAPSHVNDFIQNISIRGIALDRSAKVEGGAAGLRAQFLLYAEFEEISAAEHATSFVCLGLVRTRMRNCVAFRSLPGTQRSDWRGFYLDGMHSIGLAGGNASLFLEDCNVSIGGNPEVTDPVGLLLDGAFADSFIIDFETAGVDTGIRIDGRADELGRRAKSGHANLHIRMPIIDQCSEAGLDLRNCSRSALIDVSEPYVALSPTGKAALRLQNMSGSLTVAGGQFLGGMNNAAGGRGVGIHARNSAGLATSGLRVQDMAYPVRLESCSLCDLRLQIRNDQQPSKGPAMAIEGCSNTLCSPLIGGRDNAFPAAVEITKARGSHAIELTGIDAQALSSAGVKLLIDAKPANAPGRYGVVTANGI
ncbi:MAG: hypothetical protein ABGW87_09770 [Sphingomonadaceae bacterium]